MLIGYQNRVDSKRSHPGRKFWIRKKCWSIFPFSARPNDPLGMRIHAVDWCWECYDICWRTMRVWAYMRWHNQHEMGHMWGLQDSPAVGATRYGHGLTRWRTREETGRRTRLAEYFWQNCGTDVIQNSGVVVEPRWRYHNF